MGIPDMTIRELAKDASGPVQSASNILGLSKSFPLVLSRLRELYPDRDTAFYTRHPVAVLWVGKLADMCGLDFNWPWRADELCGLLCRDPATLSETELETLKEWIIP